ncbi:MAG: FAD-dependent thymidylate synthase [Candidatus Aadella gelida]|nr:FAD-dependent thymidylate synthase [Candidatus Aadella gelida]
MEVNLAGYNVDAEVLGEMSKKCGKSDELTPEIIAAAYARISRDPRPIKEIRKDARSEVERTRRSNSTIIFRMGHHSVAEHAVFNLDIVGVSRLAMEELEKFRLSAYTEKSQRYITLDKDHVLPKEIAGTEFEASFRDIIKQQNETYFLLFDKLKKHVFEKHAEIAKDHKKHEMLEGWAKEDARYITALATESQVGQTVNARTLELMLRRFASHPLEEIRELGRAIYEKIANVAPSIVLFNEANDRDQKTYPELKTLANTIKQKATPSEGPGKDVELVEYTQNADNIIAASLLHTSTNCPYKDCLSIAHEMSETEKSDLFRAAGKNIQFYDSMLREFEYVNLTFNIILSSACFGQLKRHRMATITAQPYDPSLGITIPESIKEIGEETLFQDIAARSAELYSKILVSYPEVAPYILTNAHRKRVLIRSNARELYHISRLREDAHAQWDIQNISRAMTEQARKVMPQTFALAGGKDRYNEIYENVYGTAPKVTKAVLPGAKKIANCP